MLGNIGHSASTPYAMFQTEYMADGLLKSGSDKHLSPPVLPSQNELMQSAAAPPLPATGGTGSTTNPTTIAYHQLSLPSPTPSSSSTMSLVNSPSSMDDEGGAGCGSRSVSTDGSGAELARSRGSSVDTESDDFRMYSFKVLLCQNANCQDWSKCPYAHPDEKATRRDPRVHAYRPEFCQGLRKNTCANGDACGYSHNVFEAWLHPQKYRTQLCKKGLLCDRDVCFFAHTEAELRQAPYCIPLPDPTPQPVKKKQLPAVQKKRAAGSKSGKVTSEEAPQKDKPGVPLTGLLPFPFSAQQSALLGQQAAALELLHAQRVYETFSRSQIGALPSQTSAVAELLRSVQNAAPASPTVEALLQPQTCSPLLQSPGFAQMAAQQQIDAGQLQMAHNLALQLILNNNVAAQPSSPPHTLAPTSPTQQFTPPPASRTPDQTYSPFLSPQLFDQSLYSAAPGGPTAAQGSGYEQNTTPSQASGNYSLHVW